VSSYKGPRHCVIICYVCMRTQSQMHICLHAYMHTDEYCIYMQVCTTCVYVHDIQHVHFCDYCIVFYAGTKTCMHTVTICTYDTHISAYARHFSSLHVQQEFIRLHARIWSVYACAQIHMYIRIFSSRYIICHKPTTNQDSCMCV
jgi:hypothetical protein